MHPSSMMKRKQYGKLGLSLSSRTAMGSIYIYRATPKSSVEGASRLQTFTPRAKSESPLPQPRPHHRPSGPLCPRLLFPVVSGCQGGRGRQGTPAAASAFIVLNTQAGFPILGCIFPPLCSVLALPASPTPIVDVDIG